MGMGLGVGVGLGLGEGVAADVAVAGHVDVRDVGGEDARLEPLAAGGGLAEAQEEVAALLVCVSNDWCTTDDARGATKESVRTE